VGDDDGGAECVVGDGAAVHTVGDGDEEGNNSAGDGVVV